LLCVQWKTPDEGQRNCPKHVDFYSKNKLEKLVLLVGFIVSKLHRLQCLQSIYTLLDLVRMIQLITESLPAEEYNTNKWEMCVEI